MKLTHVSIEKEEASKEKVKIPPQLERLNNLDDQDIHYIGGFC